MSVLYKNRTPALCPKLILSQVTYDVIREKNKNVSRALSVRTSKRALLPLTPYPLLFTPYPSPLSHTLRSLPLTPNPYPLPPTLTPVMDLPLTHRHLRKSRTWVQIPLRTNFRVFTLCLSICFLDWFEFICGIH